MYNQSEDLLSNPDESIGKPTKQQKQVFLFKKKWSATIKLGNNSCFYARDVKVVWRHLTSRTLNLSSIKMRCSKVDGQTEKKQQFLKILGYILCRDGHN